MWPTRSQADLLTNSYQFSELLSRYRIHQKDRQKVYTKNEHTLPLTCAAMPCRGVDLYVRVRERSAISFTLQSSQSHTLSNEHLLCTNAHIYKTHMHVILKLSSF